MILFRDIGNNGLKGSSMRTALLPSARCGGFSAEFTRCTSVIQKAVDPWSRYMDMHWRSKRRKRSHVCCEQSACQNRLLPPWPPEVRSVSTYTVKSNGQMQGLVVGSFPYYGICMIVQSISPEHKTGVYLTPMQACMIFDNAYYMY